VKPTVTEIDGKRVPVLGATGVPIASMVRACHETPIEKWQDQPAVAGLMPARLETALSYCAEQRCIADAATCPGCRRRTRAEGLLTFDQFVARHREIAVANGTLRLYGVGEQMLTVASLEELARSWAGEELWFWARRVIRKWRHGIRSHMPLRPEDAGRARKPVIILVEPQLADNIGMVARAMANFGLEELRLVAPRDGWPNSKARIAASGAGFVIDDAQNYPTFETALADLTWVCATTARQRDLAKPVLTPELAVGELRRRIADGQRCGVVFGRERNGLQTSEIATTSAIVMAPVDSRFASLNLAQAVLLMGYEWIKQSGAGTLGRVTLNEVPPVAGLNKRGFQPATMEQLLGFFEQLEAELDRTGFFRPSEKRQGMVQNIRSMFMRLEATEQEIRTLRGIVKALVHGKGAARRSP
jgi:tRNA/rRNA methyltransferase